MNNDTLPILQMGVVGMIIWDSIFLRVAAMITTGPETYVHNGYTHTEKVNMLFSSIVDFPVPYALLLFTADL